MSSETVIPAGYRVTISSWENDGDHRRDIVKEGLSEEQARLYVDFAKLFYSQNNYRGPRGFGNMYEPTEPELNQAFEAVKKVFLKHWDVFSKDYDDLTKEELEEEDGVYDMTGDMHYELFGASEFRFRVLERVKVEYVPVEVRLQDVTSKF